MRLLLAALLTAGQAFAQQATPPGKTTEQQARSYVASAFMTGAAPAVLSESVAVSPVLRTRLGLAPEAGSRAVYEAIAAQTSGKPVTVRRAAPDEVAQADAPAAPEKPLFALESGDTTLLLQYDLENDNVAYVGLPSAVAVAAPVMAPTPPQRVTEAEAPKAPGLVASPVVATAATAPERPAGQVVEPQVPRAAAAPAAKAAGQPPQPTTTASAAPMPEERPLRRSGPCEIKPVMTDQDLVNCGATPPRY